MKRTLTPFENMDVRTLLDGQARRRGDAPFLSWEPFDGEGARWSYAAFRSRVRRFAAGLAARGVMPGDRVLVHLENCPEALIAWFGCAYAGAVAVSTNTQSTVEELAYFARHADVVAGITQPSFCAMLEAALPSSAWYAVTDGDQGLAPCTYGAATPFADVDAEPDTLAARSHDPLAAFAVQYTSGTTARPKAVLWTHANALWGARLCALHEDLRADDVHLVHLPLFHTNAQVYSVLASMWAGASIVLQPRFSASRFWTVSLRHGVTWTSMIPFCVRALGRHAVPVDHRYRFWGNAVCDPAWDTVFGIRTIGWWGMTETVAHGIVGSVHHPDAPMSMGRPSPGYRIHVLDDAGHPVAPGATGNLLIEGERGVSLFAEYLKDPQATAAAFTAEGLFITGDRVRLGEDGWLYFADRSKDMLKVGGENVAASEIERIVASVPGVQEVAVVGMPHPMLDEVPAAFVIPASPGDAGLADRIAQACDTCLSPFKRPRSIRVVESLPRATLGKVAKSELRALLRSAS